MRAFCRAWSSNGGVEIEAGHSSAGAGSRDRHHPGTGGYVEDSFPRGDPRELDEMGGDGCGEDGGRREGGPHLLVSLLEV